MRRFAFESSAKNRQIKQVTVKPIFRRITRTVVFAVETRAVKSYCLHSAEWLPNVFNNYCDVKIAKKTFFHVLNQTLFHKHRNGQRPSRTTFHFIL